MFSFGESRTNSRVTRGFSLPHIGQFVDAAIYTENSLIGKHNVMHKTGLTVNFFLVYAQQAHFPLVYLQF